MAPEQLGKYEIRGTLGKGAMGTVYSAWDPIISRRVAIKTVRLPDAGDIDAQEELARFKREAQAAGRLTHPNIVGIFDYGESAELAYIVMEFVAGRTLKSILDGDERMPVATVSRVMADLLAGLQFSHERGVVHRDIKPANVMLTDSDGQAKIADFGIARIESSNLTQAGTIMGTPAYMSPEQFMGQTVDQRTDIYSAGVVLFQLLTGERPFEGSMATIMHKALNMRLPKPSDLSVTSPLALDPVVARAMAKRPEERYETASAFAEAIRTALANPAGAGSVLGTGLGDLDGEATIIQSGPRSRPTELQGKREPESIKRRSKAPIFAGIGFIALVGAGASAAWFTGAFNAPPHPPTPSPAPIEVTSEGKPPVIAVVPTIAPLPPPPLASQEPSSQPAAPNLPPEPRPNLTQVVPPRTDPPARQTAQIIPPAPEPPPQPASTPSDAGGTASVPRRADVGGVSLEPAIVSPPAPAVTAPAVTTPDRAATAAPPSAAPPAPSPPPAPSTTAAPSAAIEPAPTIVATPAPEVTRTAVPPSPTPPSPTQPSPTAIAEAGLSPEALRRAIASAAQGADCAVLQGDVGHDGRLSVRGVIGAGKASGVLQQFRDTAPTAPLDWTARDADGPYCSVLNLVRPYARPFGSSTGGIEAGLKDGRIDLRADDPIEISATLAGFPAYLQVDYFSSDGSVAHLRTSAQGSPTVPARSSQSFVAGAAAPPFGTDLIVAIASSTPLFAKGKALPETADAYLRDLRAALDTAKQHRSELAAGVAVVHTSEK